MEKFSRENRTVSSNVKSGAKQAILTTFASRWKRGTSVFFTFKTGLTSRSKSRSEDVKGAFRGRKKATLRAQEGLSHHFIGTKSGERGSASGTPWRLQAFPFAGWPLRNVPFFVEVSLHGRHPADSPPPHSRPRGSSTPLHVAGRRRFSKQSQNLPKCGARRMMKSLFASSIDIFVSKWSKIEHLGNFFRKKVSILKKISYFCKTLVELTHDRSHTEDHRH